ncbi:hypothetical protein PVAP13_1NG074519 [Panicum virgatum]|uniref:Uncharacterized protein n=1 Tax=Panicum virgatum TaxID=38727 RepID=A0A8T0X1B2_PANVG|nr:hypothetical protein PVAP13_1NG074519 [Panicum virgatum]
MAQPKLHVSSCISFLQCHQQPPGNTCGFYTAYHMMIAMDFTNLQDHEAAQQERSTFIDLLLPLLSEYDNLQPSVFDAQSIVGNLKGLFKILQKQEDSL